MTLVGQRFERRSRCHKTGCNVSDAYVCYASIDVGLYERFSDHAVHGEAGRI